MAEYQRLIGHCGNSHKGLEPAYHTSDKGGGLIYRCKLIDSVIIPANEKYSIL